MPIDKELVLKVIPMPADSNANGDIFGGWVMAQVDLAGAVIAARYAKGRMATVAVNEFIFKQPVRVGDILSFYSELTRIGRTSITVKVEVYAERFGSQGQYVKVTEATLDLCGDRRRGPGRGRCRRSCRNSELAVPALAAGRSAPRPPARRRCGACCAPTPACSASGKGKPHCS